MATKRQKKTKLRALINREEYFRAKYLEAHDETESYIDSIINDRRCDYGKGK